MRPLVTLLVFLLPAPVLACLPWTPTVARHVGDSWELVRQAAWFAGIEDHAQLLAALLACETGVEPVRGRYRDDVWGAGQVSWGAWGSLLRQRGVASRPEDLLLDEYTGALAAAVVLVRLREVYSDRTLDQVLCIYGAGPVALGFKRDCTYSRGVMWRVGMVERAVWSRKQSLVVASR